MGSTVTTIQTAVTPSQSASVAVASAPATLTHQSTMDEILHGLLFGALAAGSIFAETRIKNPNSQANAAPFINLANQILLPLMQSQLAAVNAAQSKGGVG